MVPSGTHTSWTVPATPALTGVNSFMFGGGPVRRYVGEPIGWRIFGRNQVPGGSFLTPA